MDTQIIEPKPGMPMGRVVVKVLVTNWNDMVLAEAGQIASQEERKLTVDALVDTGASYLSLPRSGISELGLRKVRTRRVRTANVIVDRDIFATAQISVQDRDCRGEVMELPEDAVPLLGQLAIEAMDWWVDLTNRRLVGNPEHDGEWMSEAY